MILIKELLDEGYTLKATVEKLQARIAKLNLAFSKLKK
ncbi:MAG: hypothetical protein GY782_00800 [Gammaproteobacteria bacterium]|nr:hypothetical protein [Gammaproteobacteria bacterium]